MGESLGKKRKAKPQTEAQSRTPKSFGGAGETGGGRARKINGGGKKKKAHLKEKRRVGSGLRANGENQGEEETRPPGKE